MAVEVADIEIESSRRPLSANDRISEVWFGLMIVLTFTCSLSVKEAGQEEVKEMLLAAFGCNLAWGILDGFMYLVNCFVRHARGMGLYRVVRDSREPEKARAAMAEVLPPVMVAAMSEASLDELRKRLASQPEPKSRPALLGSEWLGGLAIFLSVFLSTFPVAVPFVFIHDVRLALRVSNGIALVMLFFTGYALGKYAGYRKWLMGIAMMVLGSILVVITIFLGG